MLSDRFLHETRITAGMNGVHHHLVHHSDRICKFSTLSRDELRSISALIEKFISSDSFNVGTNYIPFTISVDSARQFTTATG